MISNTTQVIGITPEELKSEILNGFKEILSEYFQKSNTEDKLLTRKEVAQLLSISLPTLRSYVKRGVIKECSVGSRRLYRLSEIYSSFPNN